MWPIKWHHYRWPLVTLKVNLAVWNVSVSSIAYSNNSYTTYTTLDHLQHCWHSQLYICCHSQTTTVIRTASAKNRHFHTQQPTFLFPLGTPLRLSRNMLHGWKDNLMLAKHLAEYTYLSSIVSELYDA